MGVRRTQEIKSRKMNLEFHCDGCGKKISDPEEPILAVKMLLVEEEKRVPLVKIWCKDCQKNSALPKIFN